MVLSHEFAHELQIYVQSDIATQSFHSIKFMECGEYFYDELLFMHFTSRIVLKL